MPELDDELVRLHNADPVDQAAMSFASDPDARALFERITMARPNTTAATTNSRPRLVLLAAAAAALVVFAAGVVAIGGRDDSSDDVATAMTTPDTVSEGVSPGGSSTGSCVEIYDLQTLVNREVAFDGTVDSVDGDEITFTVNRWYRGGANPKVTLSGASVLGGVSSAESTVSVEPGTRLLVAGDGGFVWSCGFTQPYDAAVAGQWDASLAR